LGIGPHSILVHAVTSDVRTLTWSVLKHGNLVIGLVFSLDDQVLDLRLGLVTLVLVLLIVIEPSQLTNTS